MGTLAIAALPLLPVGALAQPTAPRRIDFHYHPMVPQWVDMVAPSIPPDFVAAMRSWTPESALAEMDRNDIKTAILSISSPGIWFGDAVQARKLARTCNDYMAAMVRANPSRFAMLAALPMLDVEASLAEIAHVYDELNTDGIGISTNYDAKYPADPLFAPIFEELNRREALVYFHPNSPDCCTKLIPGVPSVVFEYPVDTSRAMFHWIITQSSDRYPDLRTVFAHAGGLLLAGLGRLQAVADSEPAFRLPEDFAAEAAKLYYEISSSADAVTMDLLRAYVPTSHILFGTDSPIGNAMAANIEQFERLRLSSCDRESIAWGNAARLISRLAR